MSARDIRFESDPPGAQVLVDGRPRGKTPLQLPLDPGEYKVRFELEEHKAKTGTLRVEAGKKARLSVTLEPEPRVALPEGLVLPTGAKDKYGNPVRKGEDPDSGLPLEVCTRDLGIPLVLCPAGDFMMGSEKGEKPVHRVRITTPFYVGKYQVTQAEYQKVIGKNPSNFTGERNPVEWVSWHDCVEFCDKLSKKEGLEIRLPTGAQWEYACRAGSTGEWCFGDDESELRRYAWYDNSSVPETNPVGEKKPNPWGLYDMHGNVWEWCSSLYKPYPYNADDRREDPNKAGSRALRGGSWSGFAFLTRSACRDGLGPSSTDDNIGFRLCVGVCLPR